ncbi:MULTISPECIES: hypothetical protein [unclassified Mycobacterium]|uniref:hypothetical protein n=1 Tax=unclassified Mycobacterium TaxID=2642494 RepID=UPI00080079D0|nr:MULTISPECIES: hypothetical protein [unclassified Mycobacterium]OBG77916.1 hypothetical protein A5700_18335 [Mycobacterium sp. E1214]OBH26182.1 hypothetical protein A5693_04820 [Mycobacterium sp. E1319]
MRLRILYLARSAEGMSICVVTETDLYGARFFRGQASHALREVPIAPQHRSALQAIVRLRDGGTTMIRTVDATFTVPSPLLNPAWRTDVRYGREQFELVDPSGIEADLTDGGLWLRALPDDGDDL